MSTSASTSASPSDDDWDDWTSQPDAGDAGGDDDAATSLFDGRVLPTVAAALAHDAAEHGFDLAAFRKKVGLNGWRWGRWQNDGAERF